MDEPVPEEKTAAPDEELPVSPPAPAQPMGWKFWAVMGLIAILICLIAYYQIEEASRPAPVSLSGTNWTLTWYAEGNGTFVAVPAALPVTLQFEKDGSRLFGQSGCNQYGYTYTLHAPAFSVESGSGTLTRMYCPDNGAMQVESQYLSNLENATVADTRTNRLYLYNRNQTLLLLFTQASG